MVRAPGAGREMSWKAARPAWQFRARSSRMPSTGILAPSASPHAHPQHEVEASGKRERNFRCQRQQGEGGSGGGKRGARKGGGEGGGVGGEATVAHPVRLALRQRRARLVTRARMNVDSVSHRLPLLAGPAVVHVNRVALAEAQRRRRRAVAVAAAGQHRKRHAAAVEKIGARHLPAGEGGGEVHEGQRRHAAGGGRKRRGQHLGAVAVQRRRGCRRQARCDRRQRGGGGGGRGTRRLPSRPSAPQPPPRVWRGRQ